MLDIFAGIRGRLLLMVGIAMLPALLIMGFVLLGVRELVEAHARTELDQTSDFASVEQARLIRRTERNLEELGVSAWLLTGEADTYSESARTLIAVEPDFLNLGAADPDGRVFCSALPSKGRK
jgi:hypothetical protein